MPSRSLRLPAQNLRNYQKIMLAGKRRLRYQTYGCAYFFKFLDFEQNAYSRTSSWFVRLTIHYYPQDTITGIDFSGVIVMASTGQ